MEANETRVVDDPDTHRFVMREGDAEAELVYRTVGQRLVLVHTEVPEAFRGRGVGGRLVQAAVDRAGRTGETLVPRCPYARRWLEEHPERLDGVSVDWPPVSDGPPAGA